MKPSARPFRTQSRTGASPTVEGEVMGWVPGHGRGARALAWAGAAAASAAARSAASWSSTAATAPSRSRPWGGAWVDRGMEGRA